MSKGLNIIPKPKRILVTVPLDITFGRELLTGIFRYIKSNRCQWSIDISGAQTDCRAILPGKQPFYDGIITTNPETTLPLLQNGKGRTPPVVLLEPSKIGKRFRTPSSTVIKTDNRAIGQAAAHALLAKGSVRSFVYIHHREKRIWSSLRASSFVRAVSGRRTPVYEYFWDCGKSLKLFLAELPRPIGIFAGNDRLSYDVISACHEAEINIPREALLIGVDDDPLFCETSSPTLSSIALNAEKEGCIAAKELDHLLKSRRPKKYKTITLPPEGVVERETTTFLSPSAVLIQRAIDFIHANSTKDVKVTDVAIHLGVSRSLLDKRFRELQHATIASEIRQTRFSEVERRLLESDLPIARIAELCGFPSCSNMIRSFKAHYNMPPSQWRKLRGRRRNHPPELGIPKGARGGFV